MHKVIRVGAEPRGDQMYMVVRFAYDPEVVRTVRAVNGSKYSRAEKYWYFPIRTASYDGLIKALQCLPESELIIEENLSRYGIIDSGMSNGLTSEHVRGLNELVGWMTSKRYSAQTIETYTGVLKTFFHYYRTKPVGTINVSDVVDYNNQYIMKKNYSSSYQNQLVNALKLYYKVVENTAMEIELLHRPRKERKLPNVLSPDEVRSLLSASGNIKHRAMLSLIYSCGLRRGELLALKIADVDSARHLLHIHQAKGKKDRVIPLSEKILGLLRDYYKSYHPVQWLFEGAKKGEPYSEKSLESVLKQAVQKAGIRKPVSLHWFTPLDSRNETN